MERVAFGAIGVLFAYGGFGDLFGGANNPYGLWVGIFGVAVFFSSVFKPT